MPIWIAKRLPEHALISRNDVIASLQNFSWTILSQSHLSVHERPSSLPAVWPHLREING